MRRAFAAFAVVVAACTHTSASGGTCVLNSDCDALLVCTVGYCRVQCREDRDCMGDERCVLGGPVGVCVPPGGPLPDTGAPLDAGDPSDVGPPDAGPPDGSASPRGSCASPFDVTPSSMRTIVPFAPSENDDSPGGCESPTPDAFYVLHLGSRSLVSIWLDGYPSGGSIGWVDTCGATPSCSALCMNRFAEIAAELPSGDHLFVVDHADTSTDVNVVVTPLPTNVVATQISPPLLYDDTWTVSPAGSLPACTGTGGSKVWWFESCVTSTQTLVASTCGSTAGVRVGVRSDVTGAFATCGAADACGDGETATTTLTDSALVAVVVTADTPSTAGDVHLHLEMR